MVTIPPHCYRCGVDMELVSYGVLYDTYKCPKCGDYAQGSMKPHGPMGHE